MVWKIGLTGGIGSGKSTACKIFSELGVPVIDADIIAHRIVGPGMPALQSITDIFGQQIIQGDGCLNRKKLRKRIFANIADRKKLENILHPLIYQDITHEIKSINAVYCIISIPLLLETEPADIIDRILLIDLPEELQLSRAAMRDDMDKGDIELVVRAQISRYQRCTSATDIISNEADIEYLRRQILALHELYKASNYWHNQHMLLKNS